YDRIASMLTEIGYTGFISIEFEGKGHPDEGIPDGIERLRKAFDL
ncbi:MAG: sugar phosphate isomerase/epimerase, partial [Chloroflexia bacterium]|nr:sugar phosphate isomerase/epimerase [Chloroflexia bacterium]